MSDRSCEPWKLPPPPAVGDKIVFPLYAAMGLAITMWEMTELTLAMFYTSLTSEQEGETFILQFEFDGSAGFRSRSEKIIKAFDLYAQANPNQEIEGKFSEIIHRAGQLSMRRNDIAHGMVMDSGGWAEGDPKGCLLFPAWANYRKWRTGKRPAYQLNSKQIVYFAEAFVDLRHDIERLQVLLFGKDHPWSLSEVPENVLVKSKEV